MVAKRLLCDKDLWQDIWAAVQLKTVPVYHVLAHAGFNTPYRNHEADTLVSCTRPSGPSMTPFKEKGPVYMFSGQLCPSRPSELKSLGPPGPTVSCLSKTLKTTSSCHCHKTYPWRHHDLLAMVLANHASVTGDLSPMEYCYITGSGNIPNLCV